MVTEPQSSSDPVDPLAGYSTLSFFPRTFRVSTSAPKPSDLDDIDALHAYLKSRALSSPLKLKEQAKTIVDNGSELLNSQVTSYLASEDKNEAVVAKNKEKPQQRRPALGHKRARFSFKPNSGWPSVSLVPSLDTAKLQDPVEYFLAHEKIENAKKEIQRQTGSVLMDLDQHKTSRIARQRRPGILRKSASYKHSYPSMDPNTENFVSSQERFEPDVLSPSNSNFRQELADLKIASPGKEFAEHKVNELLDDLLSVNFEDLEGDGALTFLQKRLQIKPIEAGKICLPDFHEFRISDFTVLGGNLVKNRNRLPDIQNMLAGVINKTPVKRTQPGEEGGICVAMMGTDEYLTENSTHPFVKSVDDNGSNKSIDLFTALNVDPSPSRNSSPIKGNHDQSDHVDTSKRFGDSGKFKPLMVEEDDISVGKMGSHQALTKDSTHPFDISVDHNLSIPDIDVLSSGSHDDPKDDIGGGNMKDVAIDNNLSNPEADSGVQTNKHARLGEKGSSTHGNVAKGVPQKTAGPAQPYFIIKDSIVQKLNRSFSLCDQSSPAAVESNPVDDGPSKAPYIIAEQHIKEPSAKTLNETMKAKAPPSKVCKRKELSSRQSLAGAGTLWQSGVRRSTRIRTRPLQYWKGERFLYGRVHNSLATVIGLKYVSPGKGDGKPTIKVKSYVPAKYKELVELAALH